MRTVWVSYCVPVLRGRGGVAVSEPSSHVANGHVTSGPRQETQQQKLRYAVVWQPLRPVAMWLMVT